MPEATVLLSRGGVRQLASGHPWIFPDHIAEVSPDAHDGGLVRLEGPVGTGRGWAVYGAASRLPLRVVGRDPAVELDGDFWQERLDRAIARRQDALALGEEACRWVHSEAD